MGKGHARNEDLYLNKGGANEISAVGIRDLVKVESIVSKYTSEGVRLDTGSSWTDLGQQFSEAILCSYCYLGNGIVLAGTGDNGKILRSIDYGVTWVNLGLTGHVGIYCFCYLGNGIVFAGTRYGQILKSINYGLTWVVLASLGSMAMNLCYLGNGIVLESNYAGHIWRSINYGVSWTDLGIMYATPYFYSGSLCYLGNGIVLSGAGGTGKILRSIDYGATWTDLGQQFSFIHINAVCYLGNGICLAGVYPNGILRSTDYGLTWANLGAQFGQISTNSLCYLGNGIALTGTISGGKILKSKDYGLTWVDTGVSFGVSNICCFCVLDNGVTLAGTRDSLGKIVRSTIINTNPLPILAIKADTDIASVISLKHTQNTDTALRTDKLTVDVNGNTEIAGELKIKVYSQDAEPTLGASQRIALWVDTNDNYRTYLIFRRAVVGSGLSDQVKIELL